MKFLFQLMDSSSSSNILRLVSIRTWSDNSSIKGNNDNKNISLPFLSLDSFNSRRIVHLYKQVHSHHLYRFQNVLYSMYNIGYVVFRENYIVLILYRNYLFVLIDIGLGNSKPGLNVSKGYRWKIHNLYKINIYY